MKEKGKGRSLEEEEFYGGGKREKRSKEEREGEDDQEGIWDLQERTVKRKFLFKRKKVKKV